MAEIRSKSIKCIKSLRLVDSDKSILQNYGFSPHISESSEKIVKDLVKRTNDQKKVVKFKVSNYTLNLTK